MAKRSEFTIKTKLEAMVRCSKCPECGEKFGQLSDVNFDHEIPAALGGKNDLNNCKPLCIKCHKKKTNGKSHTSYGSDKHAIAKHKRITKQTKTGPKKKIQSRGFQTNKDGPYKQTFNKGVEVR